MGGTEPAATLHSKGCFQQLTFHVDFSFSDNVILFVDVLILRKVLTSTNFLCPGSSGPRVLLKVLQSGWWDV